MHQKSREVKILDYQYLKKMNKTTGNVAIDMIYAALQHYKKKGRKVITVNLNSQYWRLFSVYMRKQDKSLIFDDDGIQFNNVLIRKGHRFMSTHLECEFEKSIKQLVKQQIANA